MIEGGQKINKSSDNSERINNPQITIITVVYNGEKLIEKTIQSVINQTYSNLEYIIIDGNSIDKTIDIIKKYNKQIYYWLSEPDKGLYDAMNKGLQLATGNYICFLNAGDEFYSTDTLEQVFSKIPNEPDIIYGETIIMDNEGKELGYRRLKAPVTLTWESFKDGMLVCHQSIYIKRELTEPYNLKYKISADFDWVLKALKKAKKIYNSNLTLTKFLDGGLNKKNIPIALFERFRIMTKFYGFFPTLLRHFIIGTRFLVYYKKNKRF